MRGLVKAAALLLAPALVGASAFDLNEKVPSAFITLQVPDQKTKSLTLRLDVLESEEVCGYANVTVNGQTLSQSVSGNSATGHGPLTIEDGVVVDASWVFQCIESGTVPLEQLMSFTVRTVDWKVVPDTSFSANIRQIAPVSIADVNGASYVYRLEMPNAEEDEKKQEGEPEPSPEDELQAEIRELELLRIQADELEERIRAKEIAILERYGGASFQKPPPPPPSFPLGECENIQCILRELAHRVKHTAGRFCSGMMGPDGFIGRHLSKQAGDYPYSGFPGLGNHTHGNHSRPHHPPHDGEQPPYCIPYPGEPPRHGGPHHDAPPPPPGPPPSRPPFHDGPPPPPPFYDHPPPPPHQGDWPPPPPPPHHGGPPPPPPPPPPPHHGEHGPPPPPGPHHDESEPPMPPPSPAPGHGHGHRRPHHGPPPPHGDLVITLGLAAIGLALFALIGIAYIHRRIARLTPAGRRARREERRARRSAVRGFFRKLLCHLDGEDDDEKQGMLRRGSCGSDDDEDDVTMEQEIAQFRRAASMVEGLVAAEEGRSMHQTAQPTPPPIVPPQQSTAYQGYMFGDETLPAYDDDSQDASVVSDGCRYMPGSSDYTPSSNGSNADDVLGDSKN